MKTQNIKLKITLAFLLSVFSFQLSVAPSAHAQDFSTGINPLIIQIDSQPPAKIKSIITLENSSDQTTTYGIFLRPFMPSSEKNGEPSYDSEINPMYKEFFSNVQITDGTNEITEITLSPKQKKDLNLRINIARDQPPKDYYFTVVFLSQPEEESNENSSVGARGGIGTNVLLTVGPKSQPKGSIANFSVPKFVTHGPLDFILELENNNDYFITPKGNMTIRNMFGQIVGNIELGPTNILANSTRTISNSSQSQDEGKINWNENFLLGIYKAEVMMAMTDKGPLLNQSRYFFAFPLELVLGLIILTILLLTLIRRVRKKTLEND